AQTLRRDAPAARHHLLHAIDARRRPTRAAVPGSFLTLADLVRERFARQLDRDLAVLERGEQQQLDDTPLQLAHARADMLGDEPQHIIRNRELEMGLLRLLAQN